MTAKTRQMAILSGQRLTTLPRHGSSWYGIGMTSQWVAIHLNDRPMHSHSVAGLLWILMVAFGGCATSPPPPVGPSETIAVVPSLTGLKLGEMQQFSMVIETGGQRQP